MSGPDAVYIVTSEFQKDPMRMAQQALAIFGLAVAFIFILFFILLQLRERRRMRRMRRMRKTRREDYKDEEQWKTDAEGKTREEDYKYEDEWETYDEDGSEKDKERIRQRATPRRSKQRAQGKKLITRARPGGKIRKKKMKMNGKPMTKARPGKKIMKMKMNGKPMTKTGPKKIGTDSPKSNTEAFETKSTGEDIDHIGKTREEDYKDEDGWETDDEASSSAETEFTWHQ